MTPHSHARPTLRQRNRFKAMRQVQETALDLFDEHGFDAVSLDRIAEVAEVSLSSIYRHFGSKESIVLWNPQQIEFAKLGEEVNAERPPVDIVRDIAYQLLAAPSAEEAASHQRRVRYLLEVPSVTGALSQHLTALSETLAEWIAETSGRNAKDLDIQVSCAALFAAVMGATRHWHATGYAEPLVSVIDRALTMLERGLTFS